MNEHRFPYGYAEDLVRCEAGFVAGRLKLSRYDAQRIRKKIARIIGMQDTELATKMAEYYLDNQDEFAADVCDRITKQLGLQDE